MGIDYESRLVYGWELDPELVARFLIHHKVGTCCGDYEEDPQTKEIFVTDGKSKSFWNQCFCGEACWKNAKGCIPAGVTIKRWDSSYCANAKVFVCFVIPDREPCSLKQLNQISDATIAAGKQLVKDIKRFGGKNAKSSKKDDQAEVGEPHVMSVLHVS